MKNQLKQAKEAEIKLASASTKTKNRALKNIINELKKNKIKIFDANEKDIHNAKKSKLSKPIIKRLVIDKVKLNEIINGVKDVIKLDDPVGKVLQKLELDKGLILKQITCPIGVICTIFESRPEVLVQIASLSIKSGNSVILKGGKEASSSNRILFEIIVRAIKNILPSGCVQLIETREQVKQILKFDKYIDLVIPRGSNKFVKYIQDNTKIPVLGHSDGICHIFVDKFADLKKAEEIIIDAKCQYPAVCNALETLLVHESIAKKFLKKIIRKLKQNKVDVRVDQVSIKKYHLNNVKIATEHDWKTEYLDFILSIKVVKNIDEAINHINKYGSKHTDAIITKNKKIAEHFIDLVDTSSVMWNCSTRFSDGFRYGKGAEVGISTGKIHSRGPVGLEGLVIYKYVLVGKGQIVSTYSGKKAKKFTHKILK